MEHAIRDARGSHGDGFPDIIAANRGDERAAADLDGDGRVDLFVPHRDGGQS
jgi:hypothetical protein